MPQTSVSCHDPSSTTTRIKREILPTLVVGQYWPSLCSVYLVNKYSRFSVPQTPVTPSQCHMQSHHSPTGLSGLGPYWAFALHKTRRVAQSSPWQSSPVFPGSFLHPMLYRNAPGRDPSPSDIALLVIRILSFIGNRPILPKSS